MKFIWTLGHEETGKRTNNNANSPARFQPNKLIRDIHEVFNDGRLVKTPDRRSEKIWKPLLSLQLAENADGTHHPIGYTESTSNSVELGGIFLPLWVHA